MLRLTWQAHQPSCAIPVIASLVGIWLVTMALTSPVAADAQDLASKPSNYDFEIPAQDLTHALRAYARISGQQMAYDALDLANKTSHALHGQLSAQQGLDILLSGTGLNAKMLNSGTFLIATDRHSDTAPIQATLPQLAPTPIPETRPVEVVVYGIRASLRSATTLKKTAAEVRDSVVAEDIGKLPDYNLAEALQRVPGLQIGRDRGEGSSITIRGLSQIKTLLNGREIYSDSSRDLSIGYVPTEIFSNVDIYKNPSATIVEGGIGGVVNLRTHRPFDFKKPTASLSLRQDYYDLVKDTRPQVSGLVSDRFNTDMGEVGLLLTVAHIQSINRSDQIGVEPFTNRYDLIDFNNNGVFPGTTPPATGADAGDLVISPNGGGSTLEIVNRDRTSIDAVAQWRPDDALEFIFEYSHFGYKYQRNSAVVYANRGALPAAPGAVFGYSDGASDSANLVQSGTYGSLAFTSNSNYYDRKAYTDQAALTGQWSVNDALKLSLDVAYTRTARQDAYGNLRIGNDPASTNATLTFDLRGDLPAFTLSGIDVSNASLYTLIDSSHSISYTSGSGVSAEIKGHALLPIRFGGNWFKYLNFGVRYTDHDILSSLGTRSHPAGLPLSALPQAGQPLPFDDFYLNRAGAQLFPKGILAAPFGLLPDLPIVCRALGDTVCYPSFNPLNTYTGAEKSYAAYAELTYGFKLGSIPITGNLGGRWVGTDLAIRGYRTSNTAQTQPLYQKTNYANFLPSFNARLELTNDLILRLAAARQITRPNFSDLAPNLSISFASTTLLGRAGNPDLRPLRADSLDASLEYYFNPGSYTYLTLFKKNVDGFLQLVTSVEPIAFPDYPGYTSGQISRPQNGGKGTISGLETGVQSFLDFLPTPYNGIGVQANYTHVNSDAPGPIAGTSVPLVGLSKNSYNLITYYEKGRLRARMAYTYRDNYVDTISGPGSGNLPVYAKPFGTLDASIGYKLSDHADIAFDAVNILRAQYGSYFGIVDRPRFYNIYDRRFGVAMRLTF